MLGRGDSAGLDACWMPCTFHAMPCCVNAWIPVHPTPLNPPAPPLLAASTCVGTVEARSVTVPIVDLQPALKLPQNFYYSAACKAIHVEDRVVECCSGAGAGGGSGWSGESEG